MDELKRKTEIKDEKGIKMELEKIFAFTSNPWIIWKCISNLKGNKYIIFITL